MAPDPCPSCGATSCDLAASRVLPCTGRLYPVQWHGPRLVHACDAHLADPDLFEALEQVRAQSRARLAPADGTLARDYPTTVYLDAEVLRWAETQPEELSVLVNQGLAALRRAQARRRQALERLVATWQRPAPVVP